MPSINDIYESPWLRPEDLHGKPVRVTIAQVEVTQLLDRTTNKTKNQLVLSFAGSDKRLGLNMTNAQMIARMHGDDYMHWVGRKIVLRVEPVQAYGQLKDVIRVVYEAPAAGEAVAFGAPPPAQQPPIPPPDAYQPPARTAPPATDLPYDDDIPF